MFDILYNILPKSGCRKIISIYIFYRLIDLNTYTLYVFCRLIMIVMVSCYNNPYIIA